MIDRRARLLRADVTEQTLPGIGRRYEMETPDGDEIVVVIHHSGRRDCYVLQRAGDAPRAAVSLTDAQARTLGAVLSGAYFTPSVVDAVEAVLGALLIDWVRLRPESPGANRTIAELEIRQRTAMTIAAILRGDETIITPSPEQPLLPGDLLVVIGRQEDLPAFLEHVVGRHGS
jgi:TrkA domain protein